MTGFTSCFAVGCKSCIPSHLMGCRKHWKMLPRDLQNRIWAAYNAGNRELSLQLAVEGARYVQAQEHKANPQLDMFGGK